MRILLVDDNQDSLQSLHVVLTDLGHEPTAVESGEAALRMTQKEYFPLIITDIRMPGISGIELLELLKKSPISRQSDVVIITGHGAMDTAVESLRKGAYDYLNKPINARELAAVVERSAEHQALLMENRDFKDRFETKVEEATVDMRRHLERVQSTLREAVGVGRVIAESMTMRKLLEETALYHNDPSVPVLIEGETGTGKEVLARLIHYGDAASERGLETPFVPINCSAIPEQLFESELFGHAGGAYTGSTTKGRPGKFEVAENGSVFLDEVAEMPMLLQPKLLRVLEDRTFYRVGGVKKLDFTARVICAANRNIDSMVESGHFRRDLYHRLKVGHLVIPPLRNRVEDILPLAKHFLQREAEKKKKRFKEIHPDACELLTNHHWPGNIRELENVIERAVLTSNGEKLRAEHVSFIFASPTMGLATDVANLVKGSAPDFLPPGAISKLGKLSLQACELPAFTLPEDELNLDELNAAIIQKALKKFSGNKTKTARYLGLSRYALHRRLKN